MISISEEVGQELTSHEQDFSDNPLVRVLEVIHVPQERPEYDHGNFYLLRVLGDHFGYCEGEVILKDEQFMSKYYEPIKA